MSEQSGPSSSGVTEPGVVRLGVVRLGVVGAGGFGHFVRDATVELPGLQVVAVTDTDPSQAAALAQLDGARVHPDLASLLADPGVDAVLLALPPRDHAELTLAALAAGKAVLCEKPAGLTPDEVARVARAVDQTGLAYVVDHVVHHNPLVQLLDRLRREGVLGRVQRFAFENDAGDSDLHPAHWFWKPEISGGILLEHAVHFFDVAALLVDSPAEQVQTMAASRPDGRIDMVVSTVRHADGTLATHHHAFNHANPTERQLMRIDFGLAQARLEGWIPLQLELDAWLSADELSTLRDVLDDGLTVPGYRTGPHQQVKLRVAEQPLDLHTRDEDLPDRFHVELLVQLGRPEDKLAIYSECVRAVLTDFVAVVTTGSTPVTGISQGAASVELAHAATLAQDGSVRPVVSLR